jgi:hypothetical protein
MNSIPQEVTVLLETLQASPSDRRAQTLVYLLKKQSVPLESLFQFVFQPGVLSEEVARQFAVNCASHAFSLVAYPNRSIRAALVSADRYAQGKDSLETMLAAQKESSLHSFVPESGEEMEKSAISSAYMAVYLCSSAILDLSSVTWTAACATGYAVVELMYMESEHDADGKALFQSSFEAARIAQLRLLIDLLEATIPNLGSEEAAVVGIPHPLHGIPDQIG